MDTSTAQKIYYAAKARAGITKGGGIHALRHAFTTHLLEGGTDLATLQRLLGHESVTTTMHYVHVARSHAAAQGSPVESLPDVGAAEGARLARIPRALTVSGPRFRSTGFKRPAGQGEECTSCVIRRAD